jgi:tetratricopeptide (TPR) repeat protein
MTASVNSIITVASILVICNFRTYAQSSRAVFFERQTVAVESFKADGFILDIGGGGEGVIGQLMGDRVISIDPYKDELVNAPSSNLKIIMDGRDLKFLDNSFSTAAIFYTMMYINPADHEKVFSEVKRVLKHGGKLLVWDVILPVSKDTTKWYGIYRFDFMLPGKTIETGYGARFPKEKDLDLAYYIELARRSGFKVITAKEDKPSIFLELSTPPSIGDTLCRLIDKAGTDAALKEYFKIKTERKSDFYFGEDDLVSSYNRLMASGKTENAISVFNLALKEYEVDERTVNSFGYKLLNAKKTKEAIEVFITNTKKHPQSGNAFDSLAEAYMKDGQKDLAIKYYKISLDLDPGNVNAAEMLKKLR